MVGSIFCVCLQGHKDILPGFILENLSVIHFKLMFFLMV